MPAKSDNPGKFQLLLHKILKRIQQGMMLLIGKALLCKKTINH